MRRGAGLVKGDEARSRLQGRREILPNRRGAQQRCRQRWSSLVKCGCKSVGPERAGDGTESVMMTPGYLWARLMHAGVGGGVDGVVRQAGQSRNPV